MMQQHGLVSVIIPVFNRPEMLREAFASVIAQHYRPLEIILVDDGSTDQTPQVIHSLLDEHPATARSIRIDNRGPGGAREAGRQIARGEFIQYLDSDDLLYPDKLAEQVAALDQRPDCAIAYGPTTYRVNDRISNDYPGKSSDQPRDYLFPALLRHRWWSTGTALYRSAIDVPWSNLRQEEDWEFEARVAVDHPRLIFVDTPTLEIRHHTETRASSGDASTKLRLAERCKARQSIYESALRAGQDPEAPEFQHFGRAAFLLARQCAAAGLDSEASQLLGLSRKIIGGSRRFQPLLFALAARVLGWKRAGVLSESLDRWRS